LYIRRALLIVRAALILILALLIIRTVMMPQELKEILGPNPAAGTDSAAEINLPNLADTSAPDCAAIIERNIFGAANEPFTNNNIANVVPGPAGQELGLSLLGTIAGSPSLARAVIKHTDNNIVNMYKTGDMVAAASIEAIKKDAVILLYKGRKKILRLNTTDHANADSDKESMPQNSNALAAIPSDQIANENMSTTISRIEAILDKAVIKPHSSDGQIQGLRLSGLEDVPLAKDFGLRNGDIIQFVNGQRLTSKQKAFQVFKKARNQPSINIELSRDGKTKELLFDLP
jgi:general secretion pathway protein C